MIKPKILDGKNQAEEVDIAKIKRKKQKGKIEKLEKNNSNIVVAGRERYSRKLRSKKTKKREFLLNANSSSTSRVH